MSNWSLRAIRFIDSLADPLTGGSSSVPHGNTTLYGTCYSAMAKAYVQGNSNVSSQTREYLLGQQDPESGLMMGPELRNYWPPLGVTHDREHLLFHLTCTAIPTFQHFGIRPKYEIRAAHQFCDLDFLGAWLDRRDLRNAWLEGNNLLFAGQLLVYLRDVERRSQAQSALDLWFQWLDDNIDPKTNLWGTNGFCSAAEAVYGGYHQLLVYYHENHPLRNPKGLVDTVLGLQHSDGGFNPEGNGGACEDVDSVDILVNLYKRFDYRRAAIRHAITRCTVHILATQNDDGGFPYNRGIPQSHMQIPGTEAPANVSTAFATWFRVHTLALCAEIIPSHPAFTGFKFHFNNALCMGWHASPALWKLDVGSAQLLEEKLISLRSEGYRLWKATRRRGGNVLHRAGFR